MKAELLFAEKTILLVEDEIILAERLVGMLKTLGCLDVLFAANLEDAEEIIETEPVDLALLDVNMADGMLTVDLGWALADRGASVVFMSGFNPEEMARATRGFEFLAKPVSLPRLKSALNRSLLRDLPIRSQARDQRSQLRA